MCYQTTTAGFQSYGSRYAQGAYHYRDEELVRLQSIKTKVTELKLLPLESYPEGN